MLPKPIFQCTATAPKLLNGRSLRLQHSIANRTYNRTTLSEISLHRCSGQCSVCQTTNNPKACLLTSALGRPLRDPATSPRRPAREQANEKGFTVSSQKLWEIKTFTSVYVSTLTLQQKYDV
ncbi:hypothetical protein EVAR_46893_1 [Eumeta japonica]|uniref:Uncharacterized protein n=1 Tax=Eumeta variegata TaxID=151549 RepID=A0A4C1YEJ8_EUMVA|nr:hypothetical protein EVAR_46893_1 [Eumeta japonica]